MEILIFTLNKLYFMIYACIVNRMSKHWAIISYNLEDSSDCNETSSSKLNSKALASRSPKHLMNTPLPVRSNTSLVKFSQKFSIKDDLKSAIRGSKALFQQI